MACTILGYSAVDVPLQACNNEKLHTEGAKHSILYRFNASLTDARSTDPG